MDDELKSVKEVSGKLKETDEKITEYSATKDGITRSVRIREVENGFIVEICEEGHKDGDWHYAKQTHISEVNPLDAEEKSEKMEEGFLSNKIKDALDGLRL